MLHDRRLARLGVLGLLVLASCFHGPRPSATLAPLGPDAAPRRQGPFAVVFAGPKGHIADRKQPGITVLFSRAVRSVEMGESERLPAITIATKAGASVPGSWRWTGTRGLLFTPDGELPGGNDFVVTVPGDVRALDGSVLGKPYTLTLESDGPAVEQFRVLGPHGVGERSLPADASFRVQFDQSVDPAAVAAATTLRVFKADGDRGETVRVKASREPARAPAGPSASAKPGGKPGAKSPPAPLHVPDSYVVVLTPERPLPLDHQVELTVANLKGTGGPRPMSEPHTRSMRTHGPLRFVDFYCPRIETKGRCRANGDLKVTMSTPVSPEELRGHLRLAKLPPRKAPKAGAPARPVDATTDHWLNVAPKLGQRYTVTLAAGMRDVFGQKLERDATFDLEVESPLTGGAPAPAKPDGKPGGKPGAKPTPPPRPAFAKRPDARPLPDATRPHRERLPYSLELALTGHVLEANVPHRVPISSVNMPTYASLAAGLTDDQATSYLLANDSAAQFVERNGLTATWRSPQAAANQRAVDFIDLDATLSGRKGRGPALLVLSPPGSVSGGGGRAEAFVTVTDLGVTAKLSPFGGLVWVTQLSTGKPVAGASVGVRTAKGGEVFAATTDAQGLAVVPIEKFDPVLKHARGQRSDDGEEEAASDQDTIRKDAAIVVRAGDDWTATRIETSAVDSRLASSFQLLSREGRWAGMLFADRGVFRPGETAKVSGIVRVVEGGGLRTIPGRELRVQLKDRNSEQIFDGRAKCDDFGTFALDVKIPATAEIGAATLVATAPPGGRTNTTLEGDFRHEIRILAYKPNEFKVAVEPGKAAYVRGDTAVFTTQGDYLYGAPMAGAKVTSTVSRQEVPFTPPGVEGYTVTDDVFTGDYPDDTKGAEEVDSQEGALDGKGAWQRSVSLAFNDQRRPERVMFDAEVQDLSRATVSARSSVVVHPGEFYVALHTPKDRFVAAGTALKTDVAAVEPTGARRANVKVKLELVERRWNAVAGEQPDGRRTSSSAARDTVVSSCEALTTAAAAGCDLRVAHAGYYIVRATASDPRGNTVRASTSIYGTEDSPTAQAAWASDDRHEIKLETNKTSYEVGDTAKVVLRNPFKEGQALVTVERDGVLWRKVVPIKGPLPVVDVPIEPRFYPNAFVSVVALRGRVSAPPQTLGADVGAPDYRFGYAELHVNEEAHRLQVKVTEPKQEYQPGATVEADVVVQDRAGKPVESALTFYVVDEGVLALTSYVTPDPLPAFVKRRKLRVFTLDNREGLAHILPVRAGEQLSPLGYEYALARNAGDYDKGDDGGDGGQKRADFRTTAFFQAGKKTDKAGRAHFSFKLPDNLTTFRVMAVAAGADDHFGSGDSKITTYRSLMARPALPRILRVGDALEASVIVSSKATDKAGDKASDQASRRGGEDMSVDVRMEARGLAAVGPTARRVTMKRGGQTEVRFPVKATAPGEVTLAFEVRSGAEVDKVELKRKVDVPMHAESQVVYGETADEVAIALGDLGAMRRDFGGLEVRLGSSALVGLGTTVDHLADYPYGCTEQVTSRLLPLLSGLDLSPSGRAAGDKSGAIDAAVATLVKRQNSDGGFGFWDGSPSEPWLSAYALLAVSGANDKKRFVPRDVIEQARSYLTFRLAASTRRLAKPGGGEPDEAEEARGDAGASAEAARAKAEKEAVERVVDYASAAMIADALVTAGSPNPGALNILFDARAGQRLSAKASLLHAMAKADMSAAQLKTLAGEIEGRLRVAPNGVDIDDDGEDLYGSILESHGRTLAMVLRALLAVDPKHPHAGRIARRLLALRQPHGAWRTTQEDGWALMALADYRRLQESGADSFEARALLGGDELLTSKFAAGALREDKAFLPADKLAARGPNLLFTASGGRAFYAAELRYATATLPAKARDEGLFVTKYVRGVAPSAVAEALASIPKKTAESVSAGDLVVVDLLFESAEPREQVVLDDPLPAGLEALDYDIDTTSKASRDRESKGMDPKTAWLGTTFRTATSRREVRDDRVVTTFDKLEPGMYRIRYLARATSVGTFVVPPTRIEAMYAPEVYGRTGASTLAVTPKAP
ncbi:MAG TPA: MG2 domain-containing protein [Polyangiaceae bacterium]|nr:MG2 domain-containing protein [Polyangiaceae bacterium]